VSRNKLGKMQQYLLSEIATVGDWVSIGVKVQGSNYGGQKKHETMVMALEQRGLLEVRGEPGSMEARALPAASDFI
jgi:hypothetical protein